MILALSGWVFFFLVPLVVINAAVILVTGPQERYYHSRTRTRDLFAYGVVVVACIVALVNGCGYKQALDNSVETREFTVNHKERTGGEDSKWLVFTNHGVFSVDDSLFLWKFDASDRYNEIRVGKTYRCQVAGWRIHFTSDYENLIDCEES